MRSKIFIAIFLAISAFAWAQAPAADDGFLASPPAKAAWLVDWGGASSTAGLYGIRSADATLNLGTSANLWLRMSLPAQWMLYVRLRDYATYAILPAPDPASALANAWQLDAAYLQMTVTDAGFSVALGRKPFLLGSGLALQGSGDGIEMQLASPWFNAKAFGFYTGLLKPEFSAYGKQQWDDDNGARRYFAAYSAGVPLWGHELSVMGMYQGDFGLETAQLYTSWYTGLQAKGVLLGGDYLLEWFWEGGRSPIGQSIAVINSFGGTAAYHVVFQPPLSPYLDLQYSLASGDPDRAATDGSTGNASGQDLAFQAFGQVDGGSAFDPYFSNIHVLHAGFGLDLLGAALDGDKSLKLAMGYYYYVKYDAAGVVNQGEASLPVFGLGHGADLSLKWAPFTDLSFVANGGAFFPGPAFPVGEPARYKVSLGISLSF